MNKLFCCCFRFGFVLRKRVFTHQGRVSKLFIHSSPGFLISRCVYNCEALCGAVGGSKVAQQQGRTCHGGTCKRWSIFVPCWSNAVRLLMAKWHQFTTKLSQECHSRLSRPVSGSVRCSSPFTYSPMGMAWAQCPQRS